ncbi:MAG: citrate synthase [Actinobacteria bacterium]|jgi:citrate synthase|nr:citrate synthase [Actinomycetota bacterium]
MSDTAKIVIGGAAHDLPIVVGTEGDRAVDITKLRVTTGHVTLDEGYANTGSCRSAITFVDGEKGILRYRGIPIEQLAMNSTFVETCWLLIYGRLPTQEQLKTWSGLFTRYEMIHEGLYKHFDGFPPTGHPMAILSAMINAGSCYEPDMMEMESDTTFQVAAARLISKIRTIAAASYKASIGQPIVYPKPHLDYCSNFLHMMFSLPYRDYEPDPDSVAALQMILILHADHEQNCSSSTVRMVASSGANMFASCAAGVCALWGRLHGGANAAVVEMLQQLHDQRVDLKEYVTLVKGKESPVRLMGFGHRVYKQYDPRATILKEVADRLLGRLKRPDPLLEIAKRLEDVALNDPYFIERRLYPNVDFYSGVILRAMGIPVNMFTVMFAMGRMPGWIANWKEVHNGAIALYRPRQVYVGEPERRYVPIHERSAAGESGRESGR